MPSTGILEWLSKNDSTKQLAKFIEIDNFSRRFLLPNGKFNLGVTFIVPHDAYIEEMLTDGNKFVDMYRYLVLPICITCEADIQNYKTIPVLYASNRNGVTIKANSKKFIISGCECTIVDEFKPSKSFYTDEPRSISILKCHNYDPKPVEASPLDLGSKKIVGAGRKYGGAKYGDENMDIEAFNRMLFSDWLTQMCKDGCATCDPYISVVCQILAQLREKNNQQYESVKKFIDLCPMICYYILINPTSQIDPEIINGLIANVNLGVDSYLPHFGGEDPTMNTTIDMSRNSLVSATSAMTNGILDEYKKNNKTETDLWRDEFRFIVYEEYKKCYVRGAPQATLANAMSLLRLIKMYPGNINNLGAERHLTNVTADIKSPYGQIVYNFINSSDYMYYAHIADAEEQSEGFAHNHITKFATLSNCESQTANFDNIIKLLRLHAASIPQKNLNELTNIGTMDTDSAIQ